MFLHIILQYHKELEYITSNIGFESKMKSPQKLSCFLSEKNLAEVPFGANRASQTGVSAPSATVLCPLWELMSVLTYPGQHAFTSISCPWSCSPSTLVYVASHLGGNTFLSVMLVSSNPGCWLPSIPSQKISPNLNGRLRGPELWFSRDWKIYHVLWRANFRWFCIWRKTYNLEMPYILLDQPLSEYLQRETL